MSDQSSPSCAAGEVIQARAALDQYIASNDAKHADGVYDPAFLLTTDDGIQIDRHAMLLAIGDRGCLVSVSEMCGSRVRVRGDTAVVTGVLRQKGARHGVPFERRSLVTDTWVLVGGRWRLLAGHTSAIDRA